MADLARLKSALRKADAAGDTQAATRLAAAIRRQQEGMTHRAKADPGPQTDISKGEGALRSGFQGATFGFGDEIVAGATAAIHPLVNPDDGSNFSQRYDHYLGREREKMAEFGDANRGTALAAEIGGALPTALLTGGAALAGRGIGSTAMRGAGVGAVDGLIYGAGTSEGGAMERAKGAAVGAGIGAGAGAATPFLAAGGKRAVQAVADPIAGLADAVTGRGSTKRAARSISRTMDRSGQSADDITNILRNAAADGQPEMIMADALGNSGQRSLAGVARQPGNMRDEIVQYLNKRQDGQGERLSSFVSDELGGAQTAKQATSSLEAARKAEAKTLYDAARKDAGPVNLNGALDVIDTAIRRDPILGETALSQGEMGRRLQGLRDRLQKGGEQLIDFDEVLNIKIDLRRTMDRNPQAAEDLRQVYAALDSALEGASDGYRAANDSYRAASDRIDAVGAGEAAAAPRRRAADTLDEFSRLPGDQSGPYRSGYADNVLRSIENQPPGTNSARQLTTPKREAELGALATDPAKLKRQVDREGVMFETRRAATGGSQTAENLADQADVNGQVGMIANLFSGRLGAAAMDGARSAGRTATGMNEATRDIIAKALMSKDPQKALAPVLAQAARDQRSKQVADALMRTGAIRGFIE